MVAMSDFDGQFEGKGPRGFDSAGVGGPNFGLPANLGERLRKKRLKRWGTGGLRLWGLALERRFGLKMGSFQSGV